MNKAFNRKGKLSFKTAYPYQYVIAYFVKNHVKPSAYPVFGMYGDEIEIYKTRGGTTFWVSEQVPQTNSLDGYSELEFTEVRTLIQPT